MKATLKLIVPKVQDIKGFILETENPLIYVPGQYVMIRFLDDEEKRAFSIVDYDRDTKELTIIVKKNGSFTQRLFSAGEGQEFEILGPYGRFTIPDDAKKKIVMIGGGIGITPLYNMAINHMDKDITIYYTAKDENSSVLLDELKYANLDLRCNFTKTGERLKPEDVYAGDVLYYICGPLAMIETFRDHLLELGVDENNIRSEDFT